ncbi:MAG: MFS transporter, partial [Chloroflexota bacterium]
QGGFVNILGYQIEADAFFPFSVSLSVILQVFFLPVLGTLADYTPLKKTFMMFFAYVGSAATILLFFIQGDLVVWGGVLFVIANLSFGAAIVFYNAFLPDIASADKRDTVSSQGYAYGFVGGGLLLLVNLLMFTFMENKGLAVRLSLASAGVWWLVFTFLYPNLRLVQRPPKTPLPPNANYLTYGIKEFIASLKEMATHYPKTLQYLIAYLIYNDGIQTVISVSTIFAVSELNAASDTLIQVVLMVQFVAAGGAMLFNYIASRIGTRPAIMITLVIWCGLILYAYTLLDTIPEFWVLGFGTGIVMGSSQALSRSLFSQMIPKGRESAYFGLYIISDRGTSWIGPLVFALAVQATGSSRAALLPILSFFAIGLVILYFTNVRQAIEEAGNEVPAVV